MQATGAHAKIGGRNLLAGAGAQTQTDAVRPRADVRASLTVGHDRFSSYDRAAALDDVVPGYLSALSAIPSAVA